MFNLFASLAEFERDIIRERTKAGLTAARARGRQGGRPKGQAAKMFYLQQDRTVVETGQLFGVGRATIYRYSAHLTFPTGGSMGAVPGT
jgi:DNA invertase Pin-like site-specific DNA recombinase